MFSAAFVRRFLRAFGWRRARKRSQDKSALAMRFGFALPYDDGYVYLSTHSAGFFSNCSTTLEDVLTLARNGRTVLKIDFSRGMELYKEGEGDDVYTRFFSLRPEISTPKGLNFGSWDVHSHYRAMPLEELSAAVRHYFSPSEEVVNLSATWLNETRLDPDRTIALYFRGTDKAKEVLPVDIERCLDVVARIDAATGEVNDILVQTDQAQAREAALARFGPRVRYFREMPVSRGRRGLHKRLFGAGSTIERELAGIQILAAVLIMARCRYLICATSNVAAWAAMYRGHAQRIFQFDAEGKLVEPFRE